MTIQRGWVSEDKKWRNIGEVRYTADWEDVRPGLEGKEEIDPDFDIVFCVRVFTDKESAIKFAKEKYGDTAYGQVTVTRQIVDWFVREDRIAEWVDTRDREHIDGD
jgi:hypothetical protein